MQNGHGGWSDSVLGMCGGRSCNHLVKTYLVSTRVYRSSSSEEVGSSSIVVGSLQSTWACPLDQPGEGQTATTLVSATSTTGGKHVCMRHGVNESRPWGWCVPRAASVRGAQWPLQTTRRIGNLDLRPFVCVFFFFFVCKTASPRE